VYERAGLGTVKQTSTRSGLQTNHHKGCVCPMKRTAPGASAWLVES
jgi:hypothetical protein